MALISFPQALRLWADRDPERPAITDAERTVTRGELERRTNRLARAYAALGVTPDRFVTIGLPNTRGVPRGGDRRLEARRDAPADLVAAAGRRARGHRRAGGRGAGRRRARVLRRGSAHGAAPLRARPGAVVRCAARPDRHRVEGAHLGWKHGPSEAHRRRHAGHHRPRRADAVPDPARRRHRDAGSALPQRAVQLVVSRTASREPRRVAAALRRARDDRGH